MVKLNGLKTDESVLRVTIFSVVLVGWVDVLAYLCLTLTPVTGISLWRFFVCTHMSADVTSAPAEGI